MFTYAGNPRAQWLFDSPNDLATILGMALLGLAGVIVWILRRFSKSGWLRTVFAVGLGSAMGLLMLELLRTYSRGGWVAFLAGLGLFLISLKPGRGVPWLMLALFVALLFMLPNGLSRADPAAGGVDRSVGNRWLVWKGALTMTSEHWLGGVGSGEFGKQFTPWYQPLKMNTRYLAALNNYLTLSAERGILTLWGYLCFVFGILWMAWLKCRKTQNAWMLGIVSAHAKKRGQFSPIDIKKR